VQLRRPTRPHFCTRSRKWGSFVIGRKTIKKRMRARLLAIKIELRRIMHDPIAKTGAWMKRMLQGHLNYFAVSGNHPSLWWFFNKVKRLWLMSLRRRSQKARLSWEKFIRLVARQVTASTPKPEGGDPMQVQRAGDTGSVQPHHQEV
jgi:RNA-directed DNA polymerase